MKTAAIILAAGSGKRMQAGKNKVFLTLQGKTVLEHTVQAFQESALIDGILLVTKDTEMAWVERLVPRSHYDKIIGYTIGGKERQDSVLCGLENLPTVYERVLIHDGARPFVTEALIAKLLAQLTPECGVIAGVPVKDTIKRVDAWGMVQETPARSQLWQVQTPQCFYTAAILECYRKAQENGFIATDDASVAEQYGLPVKVEEAYYENIKLTTPEDLETAEIFYQRMRKNEK